MCGTMRRRVLGYGAFGVAVLVFLALAACVPIPTSPPGTVSTPGEPAGTPVPPQQATATAAVVNATAQAAIQQSTLDAAQATLEQQLQLATQQVAQATSQALATAQAEATLGALALQLTTQAEATTQTQATLDAQVQATATEQAYQRTATAQVVNSAATATERAYQATTTAQALSQEATATAAVVSATAQAFEQAFQATRVAAADAARRREEAFRYGIVGVGVLLALGLIVLLVIGFRSLSRQGFFRSLSGSGGENVILQPGHCPPITVLPDGAVQIPTQGPGEQTCTLSQDQLSEVLNLARSGARRVESIMPDLPTPSLPAPGLRSIHSIRRLDQAEKSGAIPSDLVAALAADWEKGQER